MNNDRAQKSIRLHGLTQLIRQLRAPDGCPWDQKQKKEDLGKYILEEAYEVIDSIDKGDPQNLKEELGDLLFQILFLAEISAESGFFTMNDVMEGVHEKMIRRHPHVFGDIKVSSIQDVKENWQTIKRQEGKNRQENLFSSVPRALPALKRAQKITAMASTLGFDWQDKQGVWKKLEEETRELNEAVKEGDSMKTEEELGDLLFTMVNLSRFLSVDAETALSKATEKFLKRFAWVTERLSSLGLSPSEAPLQQMDSLWEEAKTKDRT